MTNFVTYAQNFEDVMLWRALHGVTNGFYIDVGAADPDEDSVTRAFYDRGWHGINIEPASSYFTSLLAARPRDITLQCLVGATVGEAGLHHFSDTGLSTTINDFAARHVADGRERELVRVPVLPLAEIWQRHAPETVHFLKIDVEGAEAEVLRGADLHRFRPWIILAEATEPGSRTENWANWDGILTEASYRFAWFDGLNRFYIAAEQWDALHGAFVTPPNVFDLWIQPRGKQQRALIEHGEVAVAAARKVADEAVLSVRVELADAVAARKVADEAVLSIRADLATMQAGAATLREQLLAAETEAAQSRAAKAESANLHQQLVEQRSATTDLRRRIIATEAGRLEARVEVERLRIEYASEAGRWHEDNTRWQEDAVRWQDRADEARRARERSEEGLRAISGSTFWRATAPVRALVTWIRASQRRAGAHLVTNNTTSLTSQVPVAETLPPALMPPAQEVPSTKDVSVSVEEQRVQARLRAWAKYQ